MGFGFCGRWAWPRVSQQVTGFQQSPRPLTAWQISPRFSRNGNHLLYQPLPIMTAEPWLRIAFRIRSMIILFYYSLDVWSKKFSLFCDSADPPPLPLPICSYKESRAASAIYPQCLSINAAVSISNICVWVCVQEGGITVLVRPIQGSLPLLPFMIWNIYGARLHVTF